MKPDVNRAKITFRGRRERVSIAPVAWACPSPLLPAGETELKPWAWIR